MGNFISEGRGGFRERSSGRDRRFGGRDSGRFERRPVQMHDVTCDKCGKECQVPFRPTGDKPVLCNDCFRKNDGSGNKSGSASGSSGMFSEQFDKINKKLDKIIAILETLEIVEDSDEDGESKEEYDEEIGEEEDKDEDEDSEEDNKSK